LNCTTGHIMSAAGRIGRTLSARRTVPKLMKPSRNDPVKFITAVETGFILSMPWRGQVGGSH